MDSPNAGCPENAGCPDVYAVVLAFAYEQETKPDNAELVHQWAQAFPAYARELLAVAFVRTAMGWQTDDALLYNDGLLDDDALLQMTFLDDGGNEENEEDGAGIGSKATAA